MTTIYNILKERRLISYFIPYLWTLAFKTIRKVMAVVLGYRTMEKFWNKLGVEDSTMLFVSWIGAKFNLSSLYVKGRTFCGEAYFRIVTNDAKRLIRGYERAVTKVIKQMTHGIFLDIGAHIGRYSLLTARNRCKVMAVEPEPSNYKILVLNSQLARFRAIQSAITDFDGETRLYIGRHTGVHSLLPSGTKTITVPALRLETLLKREGIETVNLIKLDAEGAEFKILYDSLELMPGIKGWIVECHNLRRKQELEHLMTQNGYTIRWLDKNHIHAYQEK